MPRKLSKAELDEHRRRPGVRVTEPPKEPPKPAQPEPPKTDPDIKALLADMRTLLYQHNLSLEQLARIISTEKKEPDPVRQVRLDGIKELRITERDRNGNIACIEPVVQTRH